MQICPPPKNVTKSKGFTLIELIVVIAVMAVLVAVLAPALLRYVEDSRRQRDESAVGEITHAVHLAMADPETFDAVYSYSIPNNYTTYTDSSATYGAKFEDDQYWAPDGYGRTVTITFNPDENGNYNIADGIVNNMTEGNGSLSDTRELDASKQCTLAEMGDQELYAALKSSIGPMLEEASATYQNSSYTVFIKFDNVGSSRRVEVYGEFNGTNLSPSSTVSQSSGVSTPPPEAPDAPVTPTPETPNSPNPPSQTPNNPAPDLGGTGGTVGNTGGGGTQPHTHNYTTITTPATCTKEGLETNSCTCGSTNTVTTPALGHLERTEPGIAPTCTTSGKTEKTICSRCNEVLKDAVTIPALNHDYEVKVTEPNCETPGIKVYTCKRNASHTYTETIAASGHTPEEYGAVTPECETDGYLPGQKCSKCDKVLQAPIREPAYGHTTQVTAGSPATCTSSGRTASEQCTKCGKILAESTVIPAKGHTYVTESSVSPTCTNPGRQVKVCNNCGNEITETLAALNHIDTNNDNTCDRTNCGALLVEIPGIGNVETDEPDVNVTYDPDEGIVKVETPPEQEDEEQTPDLPDEVKPEVITFNYGYVESNTEYTPGTYETVEYEETTIETKYPVSRWRINWSYWEVDENEEIIQALPPTVDCINQCYGQYAVYNKETGETRTIDGITADSIILYAALSSADDSLENMIYMAAYWNQTEGTTNNHIAVWNGSNYVEEDHDAEIAAITEFTTTKTVKKTKQVEITAPSTTTNKVFVPAGTLQAEKDMTWAEWLSSHYNTTGRTNPEIVTAAFTAVAYSDVIQANMSYGFVKPLEDATQLSGRWKWNNTISQTGWASGTQQKLESIDFKLFSADGQEEYADAWTFESIAYYPTGTHPGAGHEECDVILLGDYWQFPLYSFHENCMECEATCYQWLIDFGTIPQTVTEEFYNWFTANATQEKIIAIEFDNGMGWDNQGSANSIVTANANKTWSELVTGDLATLQLTSPMNAIWEYSLYISDGYVSYNRGGVSAPLGDSNALKVKATDKFGSYSYYYLVNDGEGLYLYGIPVNSNKHLGFMHFTDMTEPYYTFEYVDGMTWSEFIVSPYNVVEGTTDKLCELDSANNVLFIPEMLNCPSPSGTVVKGSDVITYPANYVHDHDTRLVYKYDIGDICTFNGDHYPSATETYNGLTYCPRCAQHYEDETTSPDVSEPDDSTPDVELKELSGMWRFNNVLEIPKDFELEQTINFTAGNTLRSTGIYVYSSPLPTPDDPDAYEYIMQYNEISTTETPCYDSKYEDGWLYAPNTDIHFGNSIQYVSADFYNWFIANASPISTSTHFNLVPTGATYITDRTYDSMKMQWNDGTTYTAGECMPPWVSNGDIYICGDYEYCYGYVFCHNCGMWDDCWFGDQADGWSVRYTGNSAEPAMYLEEINGLEVRNLEYTFAYNDTIIKAPAIHKNIANMHCAFENSKNLQTAPDMSQAGDVTDMSGAFYGCTGLTGTITINAIPSVYDNCFAEVDFKDQVITLAGTKMQLDNIGSTGKNYCANCNGYCYENAPTKITFTMDATVVGGPSTSYQAEEGMTWEEWCDSEYKNLVDTDQNLNISDGKLYDGGIELNIAATDIIEAKTYNYIDYFIMTFTIDGAEHKAEYGMTWGEWVDSDYNTNGYVISGTTIYNSDKSKKVSGATSSATIGSSRQYSLTSVSTGVQGGHSGGSND